jgi:type 1 fimbria pilin
MQKVYLPHLINQRKLRQENSHFEQENNMKKTTKKIIKFFMLFNKKNLTRLLLAVAGLYACSVSADNDCFFADGNTTINATAPLQAQNITAGADLPNGSVLFRQDFRPSRLMHIWCGPGNAPEPRSIEYTYSATPKPLSAWNGTPYSGKVYETGIPGIGVLAWYKYMRQPLPLTLPLETIPIAGEAYSNLAADFDLIFIKTGPISPGVILGSNLPSISMDHVAYGQKLNMGSVNFTGMINIVSQTCKTPDVNVSMGIIDANKVFTGKGTASAWQDASIRLTNCPRFYGSTDTHYSDDGSTGVISKTPNIINLTVTPNTSIIDRQNGIMGLKTGAGSATGVGVQLANGKVSDTSPTFLLFSGVQSFTMVNNNETTLTIPLVARYIQTADSVTPGKADATATFTLNYY